MKTASFDANEDYIRKCGSKFASQNALILIHGKKYLDEKYIAIATNNVEAKAANMPGKITDIVE